MKNFSPDLYETIYYGRVFLKKKSAEDNKSMKNYIAWKRLFDLLICVHNYLDYCSG